MRRFAVNIGILVALVLLSVFCYRMGKAYDVLIDNQNITIDGQSFEGEHELNVYFDKGEVLEISPGDRAVATIVGLKHVIKIEILDEDYEVIDTVEKKFTVEKGKNFFSIPAFLGESSEWMMTR